MRIAPPLLIDEEQADFAIGILDQCISEVGRRVEDTPRQIQVRRYGDRRSRGSATALLSNRVGALR